MSTPTQTVITVAQPGQYHDSNKQQRDSISRQWISTVSHLFRKPLKCFLSLECLEELPASACVFVSVLTQSDAFHYHR